MSEAPAPAKSRNLYLSNQLCFALYAATNAITRSYRGPLTELGFTYTQYLVLAALMEQPSMTSVELCRALKIDPSTMTPMLQRMKAAGLIERSRRAEDERIIDNQLTAAGRDLESGMNQAQAQVKCDLALSDEAIGNLRKVLHELTEALETAVDRAAAPLN
ncbi:MarR family winged helix-turn-helix transcriptional regulator [Acidisphaera sp. L21]|uniref:MarR family winged helix-turn-helix transcriptional regulator n=1 Tax=Acidisphaera sp. L21 TaxID=1641851 RepID=UPI00131E56DF|nr:MarR family transcriptional regulator [Acidisphaera sp. L21]